MNQSLKQATSLRDRIVEVLREHHEVKQIGALADKLETALAPQEQDMVGLSPWEGWDWSRGFWSQTKHRDAVMHAMFRGPWSVEDANTLLGFIDRTWPKTPTKREEWWQDLSQIEIHLQKLIEADLHKARMALNNEDLRLWFVAELISKASGRIPLLEIEGLVSRQLAALDGSEA